MSVGRTPYHLFFKLPPLTWGEYDSCISKFFHQFFCLGFGQRFEGFI